ncbi:hormogonium polysaccharide biosynthesis glycosyltransferase HpsE [Lyngbya aestuarii]|uniref:hormogonium polysaccharide biosynthesis glycosyltransferase HpsE n=1 Tax=Lyngbya aestuarii TaxID=118322 RepID=UPI00403D9AE1
MIDLTVAIPTYNGAHRLFEVLKKLQAQTNTENLAWEIIVVDNNSTDDTTTVVEHYQAHWQANCSLNYCFEAQQGTAFARQHAVERARGKLIGFLDDDNLPQADWVAAAYAFGQTHPQAGAYGSKISGDFAVKPPRYLKSLAYYLAIIDRGLTASKYEPHQRILPPGAGLVIRKQAWQEAVPQRLFLNYQGREAGLASEDLEVVIYIQKAGWDVWYNPQMQIVHQIPAWRLEKDYLVSLMRCVGLSRHHIRMLRLASWQRPLATPVYLLNDFRKLLQHLLVRPKISKSEIVVACERQLLLSILLSPFFLGKKRYQDWVKPRKNKRFFPAIKKSFGY